MKIFKLVVAALAIAAAGAGLAGCTSAQVASAVQTACTAAAVGTTVYVQVESQSGGATAQNISKQVSGDVGTDCPTIISATNAAVNSITAAGQTASVTVSTAAPTVGVKRHVVAKFKVKRGLTAQNAVTIVVAPSDLQKIPVISDIVNAL